MVKKHRDSQRRYYVDDGIYFVTCKTSDNYPFFREQVFCDLFLENLRICKELKQFKLFAWVLVWDHFHLLLQPSDRFNLSKIMHFLKRNTSRNMNFVTGSNKHDEIHEGEDDHPRLQRGVLCEFIFIKWILKFRYKLKYLNKNPFPQFKWQSSYYDHIIRNDADFGKHFEYIKWNPVKHNMPDGWPYVFTNPKYEYLTDQLEL